MTQQFNMNHGYPDGDLLTSILAYEWFLENKRHYNQKYTDWKTSWSQDPKRHFGSPGYSTLLLHSVWTAFFDRCLIKLPTGEYVSPQYGGSWTLESSSLCHRPTSLIALN